MFFFILCDGTTLLNKLTWKSAYLLPTGFLVVFVIAKQLMLWKIGMILGAYNNLRSIICYYLCNYILITYLIALLQCNYIKSINLTSTAWQPCNLFLFCWYMYGQFSYSACLMIIIWCIFKPMFMVIQFLILTKLWITLLFELAIPQNIILVMLLYAATLGTMNDEYDMNAS